MDKYILTADEREIIISVTDAETALCITSSSPVWTRRLEKIAHALDKKVIHLNEYTIRCYLPRECLALRLPPQPRNLTDDQREAARQRMQNINKSHTPSTSSSPTM